MVFWTAQELPRCSVDGFWRLDHLEASIFPEPKRLPSSRRSGVHASVRKSRRTLHPIRAWAILGFFTLSAGATVAAFYIQWRWG